MRTPEQKAALREAYLVYLRADHTVAMRRINADWDLEKLDRRTALRLKQKRDQAEKVWRDLQEVQS